MRNRWLQIGVLVGAGLAGGASCAFAQTVSEAQTRLADDATDANTLFSLSFYFEQCGRPFSALKAIERAIAKDPKVPGYSARQGQLLLARKRTREAAAAYGRAADMDPATKSFRAAQARAYTSCSMLKEAAATWEKLLAAATDRQEILDAARNAATQQEGLHALGAAAKDWRTAWEKLTKWEDRTAAATQLVKLLERERADEQGVEFYAEWLKKESDWHNRATLAQAMSRIAQRGLPAESAARVRGVWAELLQSAPDAMSKKWPAVELGELLLQDNQAAETLKTVTPLIFEPPPVYLGLARVAASAHALQGDAAAQEQLWRAVLAAKPGYDEQNEAIRRLSTLLKNTKEIVALRRETAAAFPDRPDAQVELAKALQDDKQYAAALELYSKLFAESKKPAHAANVDAFQWSLREPLVTAGAQAGDLARLSALIGAEFQNADAWTVRSTWLPAVANRCGHSAAIKLAGMLRETATNGSARVGAALYLLDLDPDRAIELLQQDGRDERLSSTDRELALQQAQSRNTLTSAERIDVQRTLLSVSTNFWNRWQSYQQLAVLLGNEGRIPEAIALVRDAHKDRDKNNTQSSAANTLRTLGNSIWRGPSTGPGLRSAEGLLAAQSATAKLYQELSGDPEFKDCFDELCRNLAEVQSRHGDLPGAIEFLHRLCTVRDLPALRLAAADFISRRNDPNALWAEYLGYVDAIIHRNAETLRNNSAQHTLPEIDARLIQYAANYKKEPALIEHLDARLKGDDREAAADLLLSYQRAQNKPAEMLATLQRLERLGISGTFYAAQKQFAEAAVRMDNAGSRADAQRREQLLAQLEQWKSALVQNPEDYPAAINLYKTYQQLGRQSDGQPFLEQALQIAPGDPAVLELHARELMLDKKYGDAARELAKAAEAAGRLEGVEATLESAYELSGHHAEAMALSLEALEQGHNNGQGIRSIQEIQDLAHRTNSLENLKTQLSKRLAALKSGKRIVPALLAELALNVAWDRNDNALATLALDGLLELATQPGGQTQHQYQWTQLARQAQERHRLNDAVRVWQAVLASEQRAGQPLRAAEYQPVAALMIESGHADDAAELMFSGMTAALRPGSATVERLPWNRREDERHGPVQPSPQTLLKIREMTSDGAAGGRESWIAALLTLAANEQDSGAETFRAACGERLAGLIEDEVTQPVNSPIAHANVAVPLGLRERVESAFRAVLDGPAATADGWLSYANWKMELADRETERAAAQTVRIEEITAACDAAVKQAESGERGRVCMTIAVLYQTQATRPEAQRVPGFSAELQLNAWDAAAQSDPLRYGIEALRPALQVAQAAKLYPRFVGYAQKLHAIFPSSLADATTLATALLLNQQPTEAVAVLKPYFDARPTMTAYRDAARTFMRDGAGNPAAAQAAAAYFAKAIELHQADTGVPLDTQGKPLQDNESGELQAELSVALASGGKLDAALTALTDATVNAPWQAFQHARIAALAAAFQRAGRIADLIAALEKQVRTQPHSVELRLALADACEASGDAGITIEALTAAKAIRADVETVKRLVAALRKDGQLAEALNECKLWAINFPSDLEATQTLASLYKELHNPAGELQALTMLVESSPREAVQCRKVAVLLAERQDYNRARALLERAVELRVDEPFRVIDLAEVCLLMRDYARAEQLCSDALTRDWTKGLSPELVARMPRWKGTFEDRAHSILADVYAATQQPEKLARERQQLPQEYTRPTLEKALPNVAGTGRGRL